MRWNDFGRSLLFAAAVAAAWPAMAIVAAPLLGADTALGFYVIGVATLYAWGIAPDRVRGAGAAFVTAAGGALALALAGDVWGVATGAALAIGIARSGLLYRARAARAVLLEILLVGVGLLLARWLATPGAIGVSLALWGFFGVQAGFFAVGGVRGRRADAGSGDRFEDARRRALALLEE